MLEGSRILRYVKAIQEDDLHPLISLQFMSSVVAAQFGSSSHVYYEEQVFPGVAFLLLCFDLS